MRVSSCRIGFYIPLKMMISEGRDADFLQWSPSDMMGCDFSSTKSAPIIKNHNKSAAYNNHSNNPKNYYLVNPHRRRVLKRTPPIVPM